MAILAEDSKIMSMANTDLIWSLYPDRFVTFGNELKLYVVDTFTELPQMFGGIKLSELSFSQILTSKSEFRSEFAFRIKVGFSSLSDYFVSFYIYSDKCM